MSEDGLLEIRRFDKADAGAFADLTAAVAAADGIPAFSEYKAVDIARRSGRTVVADDGDTLVAASHAAWHHGDRIAEPHWAIEAAVHPSVRRTGVWASIVRHLVATLPAGDRHVVWGWHPAIELVARDLGYAPSRRLLVMERILPPDRDAVLPPGIELAPFVAGRDESAWIETNNAAFIGHLENGGLTADDLQERMSLPWFQAEDILMAWSEDQLAGSCWTKRHPDAVGEIYVIGVHPDFQGSGLGRELVLAGLHHLATAAKARTGMLYVDREAAGAMHLYRGLGFQQVRVTTMYVPGDWLGAQD